jgi:UDP-N-acetylmuramoyl-tripeptide--D-alanyl-D-alanine ligase
MTLIKKIIIFILTVESRLILAKYKPFIIAVTGSVGKTTTKDAIFCVLKDFVPPVADSSNSSKNKGKTGYIRKSEKSLNSEIGLPLTVIGAPTAWRSISGWMRNMASGLRLILDHTDYPKCLILEIGADHPGDIKKVVKWLHPDIAVITKVSDTPVHVEFFKSPEQVFEEKSALAGGLKKGGTLVLFADDNKVASLAERFKTGVFKDKSISIITFGTTPSSTVKGSNASIVYEDGSPAGFSFKLDMEGNSVPVKIKNALGTSYMYALLAAAAVGKARGMSVNSIVNALNAYEAPKGRMNIIQGLNGSTLIDDTYNSSPDAVRAALGALKEVSINVAVGHPPAGGAGRKIAVLGDMMELGKYSVDEHRKIGREAAAVLISGGILVTVGLRSKVMAEEAIKAGMTVDSVRSFESSDDAAAFMPSIVQSGDVILVKGSQSPRLERVTKALLREPSKASDLLVRQEKEWLEKK